MNQTVEPDTFCGRPRSWAFTAAVAGGLPAVAHFVHAHKWLTIGAILATPAIAVLQGAYHLARYRLQYGDAPLPLAPSHGVVVVSPRDSSPANVGRDGKRNGDGVPSGPSHNDEVEEKCLLEKPGQVMGGGLDRRTLPDGRDSRTWDQWKRRDPEERALLRRASKEAPLRLLVIGDSLAAGVGTQRSSTPILPETIALSLSKALGGRAVYWTCHGEPGASAAWIVRELERKKEGVPTDEFSDDELPSERTSALNHDRSNGTDISSCEQGEGRGLNTASSSGEEEWDQWRERLERHSKRFDPKVFGQYDVAIVLTGPNDMKSALLPFMLQGDDIEFQRERREKGQSHGQAYRKQMMRVIGVLAERMKIKLDRVRTQMEGVLPDNVRGRIRKMSTNESIGKEMQEKLSVKESNDDHENLSSGKAPLVVIPALPAKHLPISRWPPLRWLGLFMINLTDSIKRSIAEAHPGAVLFVDSPTAHQMGAFEYHVGPYWMQKKSEDTLLSLRNVTPHTCNEILIRMSDFYTEKGGMIEAGEHKPVETINDLRYAETETLDDKCGSCQKIPKWRGPVGLSILSPDRMHPNDHGYDFFGRYLAAAIVREWNRWEHD